MSPNRRQFLRGAVGAGAALWAVAPKPAKARAQSKPRGPTAELPLVVATWNYGVQLCEAAHRVLAGGGDLLDALERGVNVVEDDPSVHTVGLGGLPNEDGVVQLDAALMDGRTHRAGAVAALERIKNPISVARKVMEHTEHVLLVGAGAGKFARKMGFPEQELLTPEARARWQKERASFWRDGDRHDTVSAIAMDAKGNLATAVSTSGLSWKLAGRVGDSALIGAGSYCDGEVGAAVATGIGELAIRNVACFAIVERLRAGREPTQACQEILERLVHKHPAIRGDAQAQMCFLAVDRGGRVGAACLRRQKKVFRYALSRGAEGKPALVEVTPLVAG
jgi:isoaspartyl peptidase/L-asparaginase-like protein (Ntn-hydrolase superfamily)